MVDQLKEQIAVVADARRWAQEASEAKTTARIEWEDNNRELFDTATATAQLVSDTEAKLRELTLQAYEQTGNKAPAQGVSVKIFEVLNYDADKAKEWALSHGLALKLDVPIFEKVAKAENLSFVSITAEPRAQIARTL